MRDKEKSKQLNENEQLDSMFRHAENIGQTRLNNFLMTGTILFVGCGVALQSNNALVGTIYSVLLCLSGLVFSRIWFYLGSRQRKFHGYIQHCRDEIIKALPVETENNTTAKLISHFQHKTNHRSEEGTGTRLTDREIEFSSRRLLTIVPRYFAMAYVSLLALSYSNLVYIVFQHDPLWGFLLGVITIIPLIMVFSCSKAFVEKFKVMFYPPENSHYELDDGTVEKMPELKEILKKY